MHVISADVQTNEQT